MTQPNNVPLSQCLMQMLGAWDPTVQYEPTTLHMQPTTYFSLPLVTYLGSTYYINGTLDSTIGLSPDLDPAWSIIGAGNQNNDNFMVYNAAAPITIGQVVALQEAAQTLIPAIDTDLINSPLGFALQSGGIGAQILVQIGGVYINPDWNFTLTAKSKLWVGSVAGTPTLTQPVAPGTANNLIGYLLTPNTVTILPWGLHSQGGSN